MEVIYDYKKGSELQLPGGVLEYTYTYDDLHRLTGETTTNNIYDPMTYTYDSIGNIQSKQAGGTLMDYTYNATQKHMLDSVTVGANTYDFTYDANGNMLTGYDLTDLAEVASRQVSYSAENKPLQVIYTKGVQTTTVDYLYDGEGGRAKKTIQGGSTTYYITGDYEITDGQPTKYIFANGAKIASVSGVVVYYFHQDHLGSTAVMTTDEGQLAESSNYFPYGGMREHWGTEVTNYKYTGQELDPETGLYYYGARYYDTALGRFVSPDSIVPNPEDPQSFNRYAYARNNPLLYTDPSGHLFLIDDILVGAVVGAVLGGTSAAVQGGDVLEGMLLGAVSGAVFAGVGGFVDGAVTYAGIPGGMGPPTAGMSAAGRIAGGAAGGAASAAVSGSDIGQGALSGAGFGLTSLVGVPNFKPFGKSWAGSIPNRLFNSALTGAVYGAAYAGVTGGDIGEGAARGAMGWAAGEAGNMLIGHAVGFALSGKGPKFDNGVFYYYANGRVPFAVGGTIIGDKRTIEGYNIVNGQWDYNHTVDQHERAHFPQQTALSVSYIPTHLTSMGIGGVIGMFTGVGFMDGTHRYNIFERWWIDVPSY